MKRKEFIRATTFGIGAVSFIPMLHACKTEPTKEVAQAETTSEEIKNQKPKMVRNEEGNKLNVLGDQQIIKLTGEDTNGQYTLIE